MVAGYTVMGDSFAARIGLGCGREKRIANIGRFANYDSDPERPALRRVNAPRETTDRFGKRKVTCHFRKISSTKWTHSASASK